MTEKSRGQKSHGDRMPIPVTRKQYLYETENIICYCNDVGNDCNGPETDKQYRKTWRLPTKEECQELVDKCIWTWTSQDGHNGFS